MEFGMSARMAVAGWFAAFIMLLALVCVAVILSSMLYVARAEVRVYEADRDRRDMHERRMAESLNDKDILLGTCDDTLARTLDLLEAPKGAVAQFLEAYQKRRAASGIGGPR